MMGTDYANGSNLEQLEKDGYAILSAFLSEELIEQLQNEIDDLSARGAQRTNHRNIFGASRVLHEFATSEQCMKLAQAVLGAGARPVRGIVFDKTPDTNWSVPWHQDLNIAVVERLAVEGFDSWTIKEGVTHVVPPAAVLESMITFRVHLDDCNDENGPLRVLPGSHNRGVLKSTHFDEMTGAQSPVTCTAKAGDLLLMRPLLLHASGSATRPCRRRVLHIEYAGCELPGGLKWKLDALQ